MKIDLPLEKTTSFVLFNEILCLLDQAASLFWAKEYNEACSALSRALEINKEMLLVSDIKMDDDSQRKSNHETHLCADTNSSSFASLSSLYSPSSCSCHELLSFVIARSICSEALNDDQVLERICSFQVDKRHNIYAHRTLLLVQPCKQLFELFGKIPTRDIHLTFSLIIIFNMALSLHMHGLYQTKEGSSSISTRYTLLNKAYLLYKHANALLFQLQLESCWFLSLVIFNNEAQLLLMMGQQREAALLFQVILSCLCCLNVLNRERIEDLASDTSLETFVHNTSYMILKEVITAAAA